MTSKRPSIKQLEYFVAIARASNFRKAAEKLTISQPNLTLQIAEMEEALGVQLFDRSRAGTLLTPAGRNLLPLAKEILEQFQQLSDVSGTSKDPELNGTFRIGVVPTIAPGLLPKVFPHLHKRYPALQLQVNEGFPGKLEAGLEDGEYDLILTVLPMQTGRHRIRPLFTERVRIVMHKDHPLARKTHLKGRDLHQQNIIGLNEHVHLQRQTQILCDRYGAQMMKDIVANSFSTLRLMVQMNMGIAILPDLFLQMEMAKDEQIKIFDLENEVITRTHIAVWRKQSSARHHFQKLSFDIKTIAMECFPDILEEVVADENLPETW